MTKNLRSMRASTARLSLLISASLVWSAAQADTLRVTAANASNNAIFDVRFAGTGGTTTTLNSDSTAHASVRALVYVVNEATGTLDLLAADTLGGAILRYAGASGSATVVWNSTAGAGPRHPDGLSVDGAGNLYVVSYGCGDDAHAELWVLPQDTARPLGSAFLAPMLLDRNFGGVEAESLKETLVVRTANTAAGLGVGDLLLLVGDDDAAITHRDNDDARVLVYAAGSIQAVLSHASTSATPSRSLLTPAQFPAGEYPVGEDFWPADGSLLIATSAGSILRFALTAPVPTALPDFADGLGSGLSKVKTGVQGGQAYAVVAQAALNQILQFGVVSGVIQPLAMVTAAQGVSNPQGLALTNSASTLATNCASTTGCDLLGGAIPHKIAVGAQPVSGTVVEESCVVATDPRVAPDGSCSGTLPVSQVCPGYGNTVIPASLCGGSGPTHRGFALVKTVANGVDTVPGLLVYSAESVDNLMGGTSQPCPLTTADWAPRSNSSEGTIVEGNSLVELTGFCGTFHIISKGMSIYGLGLTLNLAGYPGATYAARLTAYTNEKFNNLSNSLSSVNSNIGSTLRTALTACVARAQTQLNAGHYACAARKVWRCDQIAAGNASGFGTSSTDPNPYGETRGRLANLFLTIDARIQGHAAAGSWPLPAPPPPCLTNPDDD